MPAEVVGAGRGLDVTTITGIFTHDLEGFEDGQGRAVVAPGEGLVNVGEGGRRHGEHDTAPHAPEVTSSTTCKLPPRHGMGKPLATSDNIIRRRSSARFRCRLLNNRSTLTNK